MPDHFITYVHIVICAIVFEILPFLKAGVLDSPGWVEGYWDL